jgi:voltage-gated potassium channel
VTTGDDAELIAAARLEQWERRSRPAVIAAAVVPLIGITSGTQDSAAGIVIEIVSWVVFIADLAMHMRYRPHYLRTGMGKFDLAVVVLTSPWYLIAGGGQAIAILRLARVARVVMVGVRSPLLSRFFQRLGRPFLYLGIMLVICAAIVERAEDQKHGFETFGDSLWWGFVTITTVGYGDLVPESTVGRITAVVLMLTGVAFLGTVAGSLASLFRSEDTTAPDAEPDAEAAAVVAPLEPQPDSQLLTEIQALRAEVAALRDELRGNGTNQEYS